MGDGSTDGIADTLRLVSDGRQGVISGGTKRGLIYSLNHAITLLAENALLKWERTTDCFPTASRSRFTSSITISTSPYAEARSISAACLNIRQ